MSWGSKFSNVRCFILLMFWSMGLGFVDLTVEPLILTLVKKKNRKKNFQGDQKGVWTRYLRIVRPALYQWAVLTFHSGSHTLKTFNNIKCSWSPNSSIKWSEKICVVKSVFQISFHTYFWSKMAPFLNQLQKKKKGNSWKFKGIMPK